MQDIAGISLWAAGCVELSTPSIDRPTLKRDHSRCQPVFRNLLAGSWNRVLSIYFLLLVFSVSSKLFFVLFSFFQFLFFLVYYFFFYLLSFFQNFNMSSEFYKNISFLSLSYFSNNVCILKKNHNFRKCSCISHVWSQFENSKFSL